MEYSYGLVADSVIDAPASFFKEHDVLCAPLSFTLEGAGTVVDDLGETVPFHSFYEALRAGKACTTSQANPETFLSLFRPLLEAGKDIIYIGFSSGLSGSYRSGEIAAAELAPLFPQRKIVCIDTKAAAGGHGLLVRRAVQMREAGLSAEKTASWVADNSPRVCHWVTVDDLHYLQRGGRVSKTAAVMGSLIGIKPIIYVDEEGKLVPVDKVRGRRQSLDYLCDKLRLTIKEPESQTVRISHGDCLADAKYLKECILSKTPVKEVEIDMLDNVIGAHAGPGTVALFFLGDKR